MRWRSTSRGRDAPARPGQHDASRRKRTSRMGSGAADGFRRVVEARGPPCGSIAGDRRGAMSPDRQDRSLKSRGERRGGRPRHADGAGREPRMAAAGDRPQTGGRPRGTRRRRRGVGARSHGPEWAAAAGLRVAVAALAVAPVVVGRRRGRGDRRSRGRRRADCARDRGRQHQQAGEVAAHGSSAAAGGHGRSLRRGRRPGGTAPFGLSSIPVPDGSTLDAAPRAGLTAPAATATRSGGGTRPTRDGGTGWPPS